ncbi:MAG: NAD(P)H-binding protein [Dehalococcoidia bacterium]|nr:NAD(P)H-binding protein [Dehalococcoidia bacterium]
MTKTHVVTGATGYTGRYIARRLLEKGHGVRSLTHHPDRADPFEGQVRMMPYHFDSPDLLARSLVGADTLFNTYWIRTAFGDVTHERAAENLKILFAAAQWAGVRRIVHISIANATADSHLPYYRGKAIAERHLREFRPSYAIIKPTLIFGHGDILLNNISWALRHFPVFPVPGRGDYPVQPGFVEDIADLAVRMGEGDENVEMDAVGTEVFSYSDYVKLVRRAIGAKCVVMKTPPGLALLGSKLVGAFVNDVTLTRDEIDGLSAGLLASVETGEAVLPTRLTQWLPENADGLGRRYASEIERHYR